MDKTKIYHRACFPWKFIDKNVLTLILRLEKEEATAEVLYCDPCDFSNAEAKIPNLRKKAMTEKICDVQYRYLKAEIPLATHKMRYHFKISVGGEVFYYSEMGISDSDQEDEIRPFLVPYVYEQTQCIRSQWTNQINWYQIFPDRFSDGNDENAKAFKPNRENFYGGTIKAIQGKIDYLKELGIEGIYLNPVFRSNSNHRYDTIDYRMVEPALGTKEELREFVLQCHQHGIRVMLDGVYNHCGFDNAIWQDVIKKGRKSKYFNWFLIYDEKVLDKNCRYLSSERMKVNPPYESFAFAANMPKWNTSNQETADYLISSAEYWTEYLKIDAWRLDVPDEIDKTFLREFYRRIKQINSDIYIIGEIWQDAYEWFEDKIFDGVMDYPLYFSVRDFFLRGSINAYEFCDRIVQHTIILPESIQKSNFRFLSNHDIPRALTVAEGQKEALKAAYCFLVLMGGGLSIYYGDEVGMEGENDPDCRRAFPWESMDKKLLSWFQKILQQRTKYDRVVSIEPINEQRVAVTVGERETGKTLKFYFERGKR